MIKIVSPVLLLSGVALIIFGINATTSFGADVSRFFTGSLTEKAMWMMVGGMVTFLVGLALACHGRKTT